MCEARRLLSGRVIAVLNTGSGSCGASSEDEARQILSAAGLADFETMCVEPSQVDAALTAAAARADILVVLGGDGTIGRAATICGRAGPHLIPLPGGTMNMLTKALYGTAVWQTALKYTLARPKAKTVSGGDALGHRFYCAAILGSPSLWADAREAVREGHFVEAAKRAVTASRRSFSDGIEYDFGDAAGAAQAVAVICPLISQELHVEDAVLEAVALDPSTAADLFGLAFHAAFDGWRNDTSVTRAKVRSVTVRAHGEIPVIFDGEKVEIEREVKIEFVPVAFRALVPA